MDKLPVSKLKGIKVYIENDLYDLALLKLKLNDAREKSIGSNSKSRPTINGFAKEFAEFINSLYPDYDKVFSVVKKHKLSLGAVIDFDENL